MSDAEKALLFFALCGVALWFGLPWAWRFFLARVREVSKAVRSRDD